MVTTLLFVSICFFQYSASNTVSAATGINHQINFQGKLVNTDGTNVTDGTYSIVFSLYTVASGGANIWTETQPSVALSNGLFQINLGSVTTLPGSVDFNTDNIYLGIKVGADLEMTPRIQFTSVPQAFNAEKLGGLDNTGFIQNTTIQQATSNFNISGAGVIGTTLTTPTLQSTAGLTITGNAASIWKTTAGTVTLQGFGGTTVNTPNAAGAVTSAISITSGNVTSGAFASGSVSIDVGTSTGTTGTISIGTGSASAVTIGKTGAATNINGVITLAGSQNPDITTVGAATSTNITIQPGTSTTASGTGASTTIKAGNQSGTTSTGGSITLDAGTGTTINGTVTIGTSNASAITLGKTTSNILTTINGTSLFKPTSGNDSTTAFQVQNAAGNALLTVDSSSATKSVTVGQAGGGVTTVLSFANTAGANLVSLQAGASSAAYALTLPTVAPSLSQCLQSGAGTATLLTFGSCSGAGGANTALSNLASVAINTDLTFASSASNHNLTVATPGSAAVGDSLTVKAATGNGANAGGATIIQGGTSGSGATGNGGAINITGGTAASTAGGGGGITLTTGTTTGSGTPGTVIIKPGTLGNSTTFFQIQNAAASANLLNVDTTNSGALTVAGVAPASVGAGNGTNASTILTVTGPAGGATTANLLQGGTGANLSLTSGAGGSATTGLGGSAGDVNITGGVGGGATTGSAGSGGNISLTAGVGGVGGTAGGAGGNVTISAGNGGGADGIGGTLTLHGGGSSTGTAGGVLVKNGSNGANAFLVQNASAENLLNLSSAGELGNFISDGSVEGTFPGNWAVFGAGSAISQVNTQAYAGTKSAQVDTTTCANCGIKYNLSTLTATTTYIMSFEAKLSASTWTDLDVGFGWGGTTPGTASCKNNQTVVTGGWTYLNSGSAGCTYSPTGTPGTTGYIYIQQVASASRTFWIDGFHLLTGTNIGAYYAGSIDTTSLVFTGGVNIQPVTSNSTSLLQVQTLNGTGLLDVDSLNQRVGVGITKPLALLHVASINSADDEVLIKSAGAITGNYLQVVKAAGTPFLAINGTGNTTFNNTVLTGNVVSIADSTAAQTTTTLLDINSSGYTTGYTGNVVNISGASTSGGGNLVNLSYTAATSGAALNISANTSAAIKIANANILDLASGTAGGTAVLKIPQDATTTVCATTVAEGIVIKNTGGTQVGHICINGPTAATNPGKLFYFAQAFTAASTDLAENYSDVNNNLQPGDLVALSNTGPKNSIVKATSASTDQLLGIVSTSPGLLLSGIDESSGATDLIHPTPVALSGRIPAKVSTENGIIAIGDYLTISSIPGVAMKATGPGMTVGRALANYSGSSIGSIEIFAATQYYTGPSQSSFIQNGGNAILSGLTVGGTADFANLNASGTATVAKLEVTGDANIHGSLTVTGILTVADIVVNGHIITGGNAPTVTVLAAAGAGATVTVDGNDSSGTITVTTGDAGQGTMPGPTNGELVNFVFSTAFTKTPRVILTPADSTSAPLQVYPGMKASDHFAIGITNTPQPNKTYSFEYFIVQ